MNESAEIDPGKFMLIAQEQGYHKMDGMVYADCNGCLRAAVTTVELIHALYEHIAKAHGYQEKSSAEILACLDKAQRDYQTTKEAYSNPEVLYRVMNIGEAVFNCDIYQTKVDITALEANYGSMEAIVKGIWQKRIQGIAALEARNKNWEPIHDGGVLMKKIVKMLCVALPLFAFADSEKIGELTWNYVVEDGCAILQSRTGYPNNNCVSPQPSGAVTIPSTLGGFPVTGIGDYAFSGCATISEVSIPDSVTTVANYAFSTCTNLQRIVLPAMLKNIGKRAFAGCSSLKGELQIPNSVTNIGDSAFQSCSGLTSVQFPDRNISMGNSTFSGCTSITNVLSVPQGALNNGYVSSWFPNMENITFGIGVTTISMANVFSSSNKLRKLEIPQRVWSIAVGAFNNCQYLRDITIPGSVVETTNLWARFSSSYKQITNVVVVGTPVRISDHCFRYCFGLRSAVLPASITSIRSRAFQDCFSLKSVRFLGDAPDTSGDIYYGTLRSLVTYVPTGSKGWSGGVSEELPDIWPVGDVTARAIEYWDGHDETRTMTPVITPGDGTLFDTTREVSISCATDGARIYFTTNGTTPRLTDTFLYSAPFAIDGTVEIKAIAVADGLKQSASAFAKLTKVDTLTLPLAIGVSDREVATDANMPWIPIAESAAPKGGMAARSGTISADEESWMEITVVGAGTLSFWWRVSCEKDVDGSATWDYLVCEADGKEIARIDGVTEWARQEITFATAGRHVVRWTYSKDSYDDEYSDYEDCAWVQGVEWNSAESSESEVLFSRDQIHALNIGNLLIDVDAGSGFARLGLHLMETKDLSKPDWREISLDAGNVELGADGTIIVDIPVTNNAAFYRVVAE